MPAFLCFTLWSPLAAFGDVAVGERRPSLERPARSAVLGLVAAALGIERREQSALDALTASLLVAVHALRPGSPRESYGTLLEDFHTAQVPPARKGVRHATRRDELAAPGGLGTILSRRDYRLEPWHEVVLMAPGDLAVTLDTIAAALRAPRLVLYHGRKGCALGLPPDPRLLPDMPDLGTALSAYARNGVARRVLGRSPISAALHADVALRPWLGPAWRVDRIVERRDQPGDRRRWQFAVRRELVAVPSGAVVA